MNKINRIKETLSKILSVLSGLFSKITSSKKLLFSCAGGLGVILISLVFIFTALNPGVRSPDISLGDSPSGEENIP
ncbi:MAG: hypothetical protein FWH10_04355, partial [Oscillospiraceae bacterium]|nr:hypothetical protein [Oscillospiraceae bacterium]